MEETVPSGTKPGAPRLRIDARAARDTMALGGAIALLLSALAYARLDLPAPVVPRQPPQRTAHWAALAARGRPAGPPGAAVTIVEFADYQCPFCRVLQGRLDSLFQEFPDVVALRFRHLPLERLHPYARSAATAAECAGAQGRFWEYHKRLFAEQRDIGVVSWGVFGVRAGVPDTAELIHCMAQNRPRRAIDDDLLAAAELGINGTPAVVVDGWLLDGTPTTEELASQVTRAIARRSHK